jgi:hypothetical protein
MILELTVQGGYQAPVFLDDAGVTFGIHTRDRSDQRVLKTP